MKMAVMGSGSVGGFHGGQLAHLAAMDGRGLIIRPTRTVAE